MQVTFVYFNLYNFSLVLQLGVMKQPMLKVAL